ncbi:MAG: MMPL family transporter [Planctomycetota bacterium]
MFARMAIGLVALVALAPTAITDSNAALARMYNYPASWLPDSMPVKRMYLDFLDLFTSDEIVQVSWPGAVLGSPTLAAAKEALRPFTQPTNDRPPYLIDVITGDEIVDLLGQPPNRFRLPTIKARLRGSVVGPDGEQTMLVLNYTDAGKKQRRKTLDQFRDVIATAVDVDPDEIVMVGGPIDGSIIDREAFRSIERFTLPSVLVGAVICIWCLRSVLLAAVVLVIALIGQGVALAAVAWSGQDMNAILIVLPPLVFVLTASAGIHLSNYYLDKTKEEPQIDPVDAARFALVTGAWPCILAASTTIVGLGSLALVRLWPVSLFGEIAAGTVFLTLALLLLILPGVMVLHGRWQRRRDGRLIATNNTGLINRFRRRLSDLWFGWVETELRHPWPVIALFVIVTAACSYGIPQLQTSVNVPRMFPAESRIRDDYQWFQQKVGPTINVEVILVFQEGDQAIQDDFERFLLVREIDEAIRQMDLVEGVLSARTFLPSPPRPESRSLRATAVKASIRSQIENAQTDVEESPLRNSGYFAIDADDRQRWRISFRFPFGDEIDYRDAIDRVRDELNPLVADVGKGKLDVLYTGGVPLMTASQDTLLRDLFRSFLTAFLIVGVMMVLVLRSVAGGLLAMFPNLFPTITLFGSMGLARVPLDIGSVMTASVALGIAVDGTVHFLSRFRRSLDNGLDQHDAVMSAVRHCGPAMWQTTAVCAISPLVYALSDFIPTQRFAIMMLGLLIAALIGDVLLLPALLASPMGKWLKRG